ncbi:MULTISPECIES: PaaI family thioesterase [Sphingomonas]|uniref:PaaI family thioesterase n=1 Tax=Sphingomonas TaxID=13687 RepID=UPI000DEED403|nr:MULTISPECIES: PaaI family thioesterase [Sphingomonas]
MSGGFDPESFFRLARTVGHGRALGLGYRAHGDDWVELALPWREELVGVPETGVLATGVIVSLLDTCAGTSVWCKLGRFRPAATLDLRIDYLRPALRGEEMIAHCECYKITRKVAFVRGIAHGGDAARPVAHMAATFMLMD